MLGFFQGLWTAMKIQPASPGRRPTRSQTNLTSACRHYVQLLFYLVLLCMPCLVNWFWKYKKVAKRQHNAMQSVAGYRPILTSHGWWMLAKVSYNCAHILLAAKLAHRGQVQRLEGSPDRDALQSGAHLPIEELETWDVLQGLQKEWRWKLEFKKRFQLLPTQNEKINSREGLWYIAKTKRKRQPT